MKRTLVLSALAVASTLALAACGEATESGNTDATTSATSTATTTAETTETTTATTEADGEISADYNDADIMFAQMMIPHHQQAVEMSEMLLAKEGIPAQVVEFAQGVIDAQGPEIDRMNAMLEAWGQQPVTDSGGMGTMDEMGGMDHGEMGGMSGMMSQEDMTALEEAQGTAAARLYLEQRPPTTKVRSTWPVTRLLTARIPMRSPWPNKLSTTRRSRSPRCSRCSLTYDRSPSFSDPEDRNLKKRDTCVSSRRPYKLSDGYPRKERLCRATR